MRKQRKQLNITRPKVVSDLYSDYFIAERHPHSSKLHTHTFFELEYFLKDGGTVYLNNEPFEVKKHSLCISIPTDYHMHENKDGEFSHLINLSFMSNLLSKELQDDLLYSPCTNMYYLSKEDGEKVEFLLNLITNEQENKTADHFAELCIQALITLVLRERKSSPKITKNNDTTALTAIQYVHNHFKENLSLQEVANIVGLNPAYFSYLFHKQTGFKFKEYLTTTRINYAKKLIRTNGEAITNACYESGFNSYSSFSRAFLDIEGCSPSEYAEKYKQ